MIEQYVSDRICCLCHETKPLTSFYRDKGRLNGHSYSCKDCHRIVAREAYHRNKHKRAKRTIESKTAWLLPRDPRDFRQKLLNVTQNRWGYECEPTQNLTWSLCA